MASKSCGSARVVCADADCADARTNAPANPMAAPTASRPTADETDARETIIARYRAANAYINEGLIRCDADAVVPSASGRTRRDWMRAFLPQIDHPEQAFEAIHVAGTSGKGSVCTMIAAILQAAGVRTGLHVSPYLQVATEKLWVDGVLASADQYAALVDDLRPAAEAFRGPEVPMHGIASVALCLEHFRRERVELGVIEVGVGGRNDLTHVLRTRVAVITNVGLDHEKTLGPTLADIAGHKAGIIEGASCAVVHAPNESDAGLLACRAEAARSSTPLREIRPGRDYRTLAPSDDGHVRLDFYGHRLNLEAVELAMLGPFQAANAAMAIAACEQADPEGTQVDEAAVREGLACARLPGRLEYVQSEGGVGVLLDGAHNPDKLAALVAALKARGEKRLHLVFGGLASKAPGAALPELIARATSVTFTEPRVYAKTARSADELWHELGRDHARAAALPHCPEAVAHALAQAAAGDLVLVTGSIYLVGEARGRWFAEDDVLLGRSSWPVRADR